MTSEKKPATNAVQSSSTCLIQTITDAMKAEPALEAVKVDRAKQSLSVATLGRPQKADWGDHLTAQLQAAREDESSHHCRLLEGDPDCGRCRAPITGEEQTRFNVQHDADSTTIAKVTCPTAPRFWRWHDLPWPRYVPREVVLHEEAEHEEEWKAQLVAAAVCGAFGLAGYFLTPSTLATLCYALAYVAGSWFTAEEVWERLQQRVLDVHFLMLAVAAGSASVGAWAEGATLLFLFSLSGALEHYALGRTQREIRSLFKTAPKTAVRIDASGHEEVVAVEQLRPGMRLLIKPGEQFPVDAEVLKGATAADESTLTGEATPAEKSVGDPVLAGTMNLWGGVEVMTLRPASQSALQKVIKLIREAQRMKAPSQRFTDRFSTQYTYAILGLSLAMFFVWWLGFGLAPFAAHDFGTSAFYRTMTLLVVASPCALVLSIPSAILAAIAWAARRGILFRGGAAVENLAEVQVVAMDKTGTLTTGELQVERVESYPPGMEREVAQLACSLERLSAHPLARAVTRYGKQNNLPVIEVEQFESVTGLGLSARLDGTTVRLGRREWLVNGTNAGLIAQIPQADAGHSEVWLARDGLIGRILLRDDLRPQARQVVEQLRGVGLRTVVLTGDRPAAGEVLKHELRLDDVRAGLKPEQKVEAIKSFVDAGQKVAMVGDGVNDAPSLAAAHVGVAMGARGSDAALEQAEVVLMHDRLENFFAAFQLSQRARQIIRQNLVISLGTVIVLVGCALAGIIPLTVGVVGHEGSTVVVVMNSLRLLFGGDKAR